MIKDWTELTKITGGTGIVVERIRLTDSGIAIEGEFSLPLLAQLSSEDQVFVMAFVGAHGSIKTMEKLFGISYPTVKNRLERLTVKMQMVEAIPAGTQEPWEEEDVLVKLERGEITAQEAIKRLKS